MVRTTGFQPVREDSASSLSATETTGGTPVFPDSQDGCPPTDIFGQLVPAAKPTAKPKSSPKTDNLNPITPTGITTGTLRDFVQDKPLPDGLESEVESLAAQYRFFHWHLAFPQVFDQGGFDCILGNPPWEKINFKEAEYFAQIRPEIAAAENKAKRKAMLRVLEVEAPALFQSYEDARQMQDRISIFFRFSKRYPWTGTSRINLYSVFCETGVNQEKPDFVFYMGNIAELTDPDRHFTLTADDLSLLNPSSRTCPAFRNTQEAELTKRIYRVVSPLELQEKSMIWPGVPKTPFNMSNDANLFLNQDDINIQESDEKTYLPLYESKFIHQFNHRYASFPPGSSQDLADAKASELLNSEFAVTSRYLMDKDLLGTRFPSL